MRSLTNVILVGLTTLLAHGAAQASVTCANGAAVSDAKYCRFFVHYEKSVKNLDPVIAQKTGAKTNADGRSIALIIGNSQYKPLDTLNAKAVDVDIDNLKSLLIDQQAFDEVIVLRNQDATKETIDYFLDQYLLSRGALLSQKSRFLLAYSGHAIAKNATIPSSLVLAKAATLSDRTALYDLNVLRTKLSGIASSTFHVLALINACYSGKVFGFVQSGGSPSRMDEKGAWALTAGTDNAPAAALGGNGKGSVFFDLIIDALRSAEAPMGSTVAIDENGKDIQRSGVIRLGRLADYVTAAVEDMPPIFYGSPPKKLRLAGPWLGSIAPDNEYARGGFFFLSPTWVAPGRTAIAMSTTPRSAAPGHPEVKIFGAAEDYPVRGIDVSSLDRPVNWVPLKAKGYSFAYARAAGNTSTDNHFRRNWDAIGRAGLRRGAYLEYRFCKSVDWQIQQARKLIPIDRQSLPIGVSVSFYDMVSGNPREAQCAVSQDKKDFTRKLAAFTSQLKDFYGKAPIILLDGNVLEKYGAETFERYPIWLASYTKKDKPKRADLRLSGHNPWTLWQNSVTADIPDVGTRLNTNLFFGGEQQFVLFAADGRNVAKDQ